MSVKKRIESLLRAVQQSFRPERWVVYTDDGGRLYFGDDPDAAPVTVDELEVMQDDPAFNTNLVCIEYTDLEEEPA